jgi:sugar lactone lactonase YvrE
VHGFRLERANFVARTPATPVAEPSGVLVDAFGRVWVSDAALHKVMRFEASGRPLDETGALGSEPGQFRHPGALARVGALGVAVLDVENRRVTVYDHHLRLLSGVIDLAAPALEDRIGRVTPVGLTADRGGALYVADSERDRILVFDYSGAFQRELGGFGARAGGFSGLLAVAAGARGTLVTVERPRGRARRGAPADSATGRSRVQWLDAGGRVIATAWTPAWAAGAGETGLSLAVDDAGHVAIAAERSGELVVLSPDGVVLVREPGITGPRALAFGDGGELFVAASGEARLLRFTLVPPAAE